MSKEALFALEMLRGGEMFADCLLERLASAGAPMAALAFYRMMRRLERKGEVRAWDVPLSADGRPARRRRYAAAVPDVRRKPR